MSPNTRMMLRGCSRRCPVCGQGHLFRRWFTMCERCPRCDLRFERIEVVRIGARHFFREKDGRLARFRCRIELAVGWMIAEVEVHGKLEAQEESRIYDIVYRKNRHFKASASIPQPGPSLQRPFSASRATFVCSLRSPAFSSHRCPCACPDMQSSGRGRGRRRGF